MMNKFKICIIIPVYNESENLFLDQYEKFIERRKNVFIQFVNDASTDDSEEKLQNLISEYHNNISLISLEKNMGKAEAVRIGMLDSLDKTEATYYSFLDADLSVSLEETYSMTEYFDQSYEFIFGSRILRIGSVIERKWYRFFFGRILATFISKSLKINVYDTQCGCKLFSKDFAKNLFQQKFISKWLFDVELFYRAFNKYGKMQALDKMIEVPLKKWVDTGKSNVKASYAFKVLFDLRKINKNY